MLLLAIEHTVEVHIHAWVLGLELAQHVLNVTHDTLQVYEIGVLLLLLLLRLPLSSSLPTVHVCESERLRRITVASPSLLLLLLLHRSLHKVIIVLLSSPRLRLRLLLHIVAIGLSNVVAVTWVRLLELLINHLKLRSKLLNLIIRLNIIMCSIVNEFFTVLFI